jgi:tetratricopeptide (TPR) repeat protein
MKNITQISRGKILGSAIIPLLVVSMCAIKVPLFAANQNNEVNEVQQPSLLDQESKFEREKADYLQQHVLDKILGVGKAVVIVEVELGVETKVTKQAAAEQKNEKKKKLNDMDFLLPGVPNPKSVTNEAGTPPAESKQESGEATKTTFEVRTVIRKQTVTVLHDEKIQKEKLDTVKEAIMVALKIDTKRGDKIEFKKTKFTLGFWDRMLEPYILVPTVIATLLLFFLFGPLSAFFRSYVRTLREKGGTEVTVDSKFAGGPEGEEGDGKGGKGGGGGGGVGGLADLEAMDREKKKYIPFKYVDDDNLKRLIYLIRKESTQYISLVISYLKPEYVKEILSSLPAEIQAKVAIEMATIRQMNQEQVMNVDNDLKEKVDFLIGGLDHLLKVLDQVDKATRDNILEYLKNEKAELYEKVKKFIITFDDVPSFPDQAMQVVIRELKSDNMAKALRDAPVDVLNKFFMNMSANASAVLKEEMEYGRPLTPEEIEEERKKILDMIKQLERDGKIFIREKPKNVILEGAQDVVGGAGGAAAGDSSYTEYFNAGVGFYEAGQFEEALSYFEYCIQLNPSDAGLHQYLGNSLYSLGRTQEGIAAFEKALEINPDDQSLREWLNQQKGLVG